MLSRPRPEDLDAVGRMLCAWQDDALPVHLHPGDLGWAERLGPDATAAAIRTWTLDGVLLAVGLLDGPRLLRLSVRPDAADDDVLAAAVVADLTDPARGVLPAGAVDVEARNGHAVRTALEAVGWTGGEVWEQLRRDLRAPVPAPPLRVVVVGRDRVSERTAVHRATFGRPSFTDDAWRTLAAGPRYAQARCLLGLDDDDVPVAAATVWSAGPGRPGLLEPLGVHPDHRGRGHGRAMALAAAAALRDLGASSAVVATPRSNVGAVATYLAAGFVALPASQDVHRAA